MPCSNAVPQRLVRPPELFPAPRLEPVRPRLTTTHHFANVSLQRRVLGQGGDRGYLRCPPHLLPEEIEGRSPPRHVTVN
jgi:hypothetical protein